MEFKDKVVLITGAGSGIGKVTAKAFAEKGSIVVVSDINEEGGKETVREIESNGGIATFIKADVSNYDDVKHLIDAIVNQFNRLDIAINNAGIGGKTARTTDITKDNWEKIIGVNASGVFYCLKYEIRQMLLQEKGIIVNVASIAGLRGLPSNLAYSASKHAVVGMTKTAAMEVARNNIRINAICPVFTVTPLFNPEVMEQISVGLSDKLKQNIPMKRFADPKEMANTILYLCSDAASFVTGHAMPVDGGLTA